MRDLTTSEGALHAMISNNWACLGFCRGCAAYRNQTERSVACFEAFERQPQEGRAVKCSIRERKAGNLQMTCLDAGDAIEADAIAGFFASASASSRPPPPPGFPHGNDVGSFSRTDYGTIGNGFGNVWSVFQSLAHLFSAKGTRTGTKLLAS